MADTPKSTGKLKYDLALSTTSVYDASSIYLNKTAELSINGNAQLQYKTIGPSYANNTAILKAGENPNPMIPGPSASHGKAYLYVRNLGPANAAPIKLSIGASSTLIASGVTVTGGTVSTNGSPKGISNVNDRWQFAEIAVNEFAFLPVCVGGSNHIIEARSGYIVGSTYWKGNENNQLEYALFYAEGTTDNGSQY